MPAKEIIEKIVHSSLVGAVFLGGLASHDSIATMWGAGAILAGAAKAMKREISEIYEQSQTELPSLSSERSEQTQKLAEMAQTLAVIKGKLDQISPVAVPAAMTVAGIATMNSAAIFAGTARLSDRYLSRHVLAESENTHSIPTIELNLPRSDQVEAGRSVFDLQTSESLYAQLQLRASAAVPGCPSIADSVAANLEGSVEVSDARISTDIAIAVACEERGLNTYAVLQHSPRFQDLTSPHNNEYLNKVVFLAQAILQPTQTQNGSDFGR